MAWQHDACWSDHGRCASCQASRPAAVLTVPAAPDAARTVFVVLACGLLGAAFGALAWSQLSARDHPGAGVAAALVGSFGGLILGAAVSSLRAAAEMSGPLLEQEELPELNALALAAEEERAGAGDARAMRRAGEARVKGVGCIPDVERGVAWLREGAELGDLPCMLALLRALAGPGLPKGLSAPREEATRWARRAAAHGNHESMLHLGLLLLETPGREATNAAEAVGWLLRAAEAGDTRAMTALGWCLEHGQGCTREPQRALSWYRRAATLGSGSGMLYLASLLERGVSGYRDVEAARTWYDRAALKRNGLAEIAALDLAEQDELKEEREEQAHVHVQIARHALDRSDLTMAEDHVGRALASSGDEPGALALRARLHELRGHLPLAVADRRRVAELAPDDPWSWIYLGRLEALCGDRPAALEHFKRAEPLDENPVHVHLWLAVLGGDATSLEPDAVDAAEWSAWLARFVLGRVDEDGLLAEARSAARPVEELAERECEALGWSGVVLEQRGDLAGARRRYEACVARDVAGFVEHEWAMMRLEQLPQVPTAPTA